MELGVVGIVDYVQGSSEGEWREHESIAQERPDQVEGLLTMEQNPYRLASPGTSTYTKVPVADVHSKPPQKSKHVGRCLVVDMCELCVQRKEQSRPASSLNTASPRTPQHQQESKPTCFHRFICCYACTVYDDRECDCESALPNVALCANTRGRWGKPEFCTSACLCGSSHKVREVLNVWLLQQSMFGTNSHATGTHVRGSALWPLQ
jgi:hypothetical protein